MVDQKEWLEPALLENAEKFKEAAEKAANDVINKPLHYHKGGIDVLTFAKMKLSKAEYKGFCRINVLKYVTRYDLKGGIEDLEKARFYLNELIKIEKQIEQEKEAAENGRVDKN
jgi:hypothetical protein